MNLKQVRFQRLGEINYGSFTTKLKTPYLWSSSFGHVFVASLEASTADVAIAVAPVAAAAAATAALHVLALGDAVLVVAAVLSVSALGGRSAAAAAAASAVESASASAAPEARLDLGHAARGSSVHAALRLRRRRSASHSAPAALVCRVG